MKTMSLFAMVLALGLTFATGDAEAARRFGGGNSVGMQRQMTPPPATPKAPAAAPHTAPATPAAAPTPGRSWMGPLAGLAAGLGLAALASHFGFGEGLANFMMMALIVFAVMAAIGYFMRRRALTQQPAMAGAAAGGNNFAYMAPEPTVSSSAPTHDATAPAAARNIPADFDVPGFVRHAKLHFIRLQAANDARNLDDIRDFTTPEMFAEIKMEMTERGTQPQETDVINIDANVLELVEEANRYVISVRFTGLIREEKNGPTESVDEIWHLVKPREGQDGWRVAGIQQVA